MNNLLLYECKYNMIVKNIVLIYTGKRLWATGNNNAVPKLWFAQNIHISYISHNNNNNKTER